MKDSWFKLSSRSYPCLLSFIYLLFFLPTLLLAEVSNAGDSLTIEESALEKTVAELSDKGINIAYRLDSAPMQFKNARGQADGILIDLWRLWSIKSGIPVHFIGAFNQETQAMVAEGRADVIAGLFESKQRAGFLDFSSPLMDSRYSLFYQPAIESINSIEDFQAYSVGVTRGSFHEQYLRQHHPELQLKLFDGYRALFKAAREHKIDGFVTQRHYLQYHLSQENYDPGYKHIAPPLYARAYKASVKKGNLPLLAVINKNLPLITEEDRRVIFQNWVGKLAVSDKRKTSLALTAEEKQWLRDHSVIDIGVDKNWPPIEYIDKHGQYQGLAAEFVKTIASSLNLTMSHLPDLSWEQVMERAKQKQLDVIPAIVKTDERERFLNFTQPYLSFPFVIFLQDKKSFTTGLSDLHGKTVVIEKSYVTEQYLRRDHPEIQLMFVTNTKQALDKVSLGLADAYVGNLAVGSYLLTTHGINNVKVGGTTPYNFELSIGVRKDWPELVIILNKFFDALGDEERAQIRQKWLAIKYDVVVDDTIVRQILAGAFIILLIGVIWLLYIKRKHAELRRSEEQLNRIINTIPLAIVLTDKTGKILRANPHVSREIQADADTVVGRNMMELYDDPDERALVVNALKEKGLVKDVEVHFRTDTGGVVTGLLSALPIRIAGHMFNIGIFVNLTERIKMEKALKKAKEESEQISQFKSNFLANMSHEIRTPMNAIIGMSHLALQTGLNDKQFDYINKVKISAHNLLGIINDILDFSKIEAGKLHLETTEFQLDAVFDNLANVMNLKAEEKGLEMLFRRDISIPNDLYGDPLRLGQVLLNLVQNAIKFTDSGEVIVAAESIQEKNAKVRIKFSVSDSGIGIEPEQLKHLFDPFVQADSSISRKYGGTGLGLSISRQIVEMMGGGLSVKSQLNKGSTFSFTTDFEKQKNVIAKQYQVEPDLRGTRVLIVDDNPVAQKIFKEMLESFSFQVSVASSADEAYRLLEAFDAEGKDTAFELVLMDWKMPAVNGIDAVKHIQSQMSLLTIPKIIMVTAYGREEFLQQAEAASLDGFLSKPVNPSTLFDSIVSIFREQDEAGHRQPENLFSRRLKGTVLLAEDNLINQQVARELLEGFGLLVVVAKDGQETVDYVNETEFDLVIMDVQMPGIDGLQATRMIRSHEKHAHLPIVAMTAHAMAGDKENCLTAGMNDYLSKPIDPEKLLAMLTRWLGDGVINKQYRHDHEDNENIQLPETLPGVDVNWGLQRVGGNKKLFVKLLRDFVNHHENCYSELQQLLDEKAVDDARRLVHTIQGVAGNIGARGLQDSTSVIESSLREKHVDIRRCQQLTEEFCRQAKTVFDGLKSFVKQLNSNNEVAGAEQIATESNVLPAADTSAAKFSDDCLPVIKRLETLLSEGDSQALTVLQSIKKLLSSSGQEADKSIFIQLEQQINDYDYDEALDSLGRLREGLLRENDNE